MKILNSTVKVMLCLTAGLTCFSDTVLAERAPVGLFAPFDDGVFRNSHTFTCSGMGLSYCENLEKRDNSRLDRAYMRGSHISGELDITYNPDNRTYYAAGKFYAVKTCSIASSFEDRNLGRLSMPAPTECTNDHARHSLFCPFVNTFYREEGEVDKYILRIDYANPRHLYLSLEQIGRHSDPDRAQICSETFDSILVSEETDEDFAENMYNSVRLDFARADADINATWKSLPKQLRQDLLPAQRRWINKKDDKCGSVTMRGSKQQMILMYRCQKEETEKRINHLENLRIEYERDEGY